MTFPIRPLAPSTPLAQVISPEQAAKWCRVDETDSHEMAMLGSLVEMAMIACEDYCGQPLFSRDYTADFTSIHSVGIPSLLVTEIKSVTYRAEGDTEDSTLDTELYDLRHNNLTYSWPVFEIQNVISSRVTFTAGYTSETLPHPIKLAILLMVSDWYDNRGLGKREFPTGAERLLDYYRLIQV